MSTDGAILVHSPDYERLSYPGDNPFRTERAARTVRIASSMGLLSGPGLAVRPPLPATREELLRFHEPAYLDAMERAEAGRFELAYLELGLGSPECPVFAGMNEYAKLAAGGSLVGARALFAGEARVAFNPSGGFHHALPARASGFCYLNDVVLACMELADGGHRVLFVDVDVHHGDGVQRAFWERADVLTISLHQDPATLFPWTGLASEIGVGEGTGCSVNVPLPPGTWDEAWLGAFREVVPPLARAFAPDFLVLEIGMDALSGDPLAGLSLTNNALAEVASWARGFGRPVLATGGGGYHPENTARGWALCWSVLTGQDRAQDDLALGMGGVFMESTEWRGGLRDRAVLPDPAAAPAIRAQIERVVDEVRERVFPFHGL